MENKILKYEKIYKKINIEVSSLKLVYNIFNDCLKLNRLTGVTPYNMIKKKYDVYEKRLTKTHNNHYEEYEYTYILNLLSYIKKKYECKDICVRIELKKFFEINIDKKEDKMNMVFERFEYYFFY